MERWLSVDFWRDMLERVVAWALTSGPAVLIVLLLAFVGLKVINVALKRVRKVMVARLKNGGSAIDVEELQKRVDTLLGIVASASRILLWSIVIMLVLREVGLDIAPLIAGAGIVGLAVGFGAQELVRDVISGFFMLLENHIREGDVAIINGTGGLVENVGLRTTVLRDLSGVVHVFQNGKINSLSNMTKDWSAMVFDIGVAYKEETDRVTEVMVRVAKELREDSNFSDKIKEPLEIFGVDSFGDSAVVIKARFKTRPIQQWAVGREYRRRLKKAFDLEGIEIPFPHRTVYWGEGENPLVHLAAKAQAQKSSAS
ncbi:MAG: mechanosensitive ion channel [Chitinivibrionales bacterium]|nr:mechanosensitive ion channel [Chitinivibrionales bacterium]MBD3356820.1 mechanosensitive ion channel [Chitinivibrionales bacterium]